MSQQTDSKTHNTARIVIGNTYLHVEGSSTTKILAPDDHTILLADERCWRYSLQKFIQSGLCVYTDEPEGFALFGAIIDNGMCYDSTNQRFYVTQMPSPQFSLYAEPYPLAFPNRRRTLRLTVGEPFPKNLDVPGGDRVHDPEGPVQNGLPWQVAFHGDTPLIVDACALARRRLR